MAQRTVFAERDQIEPELFAPEPVTVFLREPLAGTTWLRERGTQPGDTHRGSYVRERLDAVPDKRSLVEGGVR
ncbi:hypothetical protein [Streptomyces sp. NPDC002845]